ncbi:MAG: glycosyltransferase family 9 protein [Candidatus Omnitrophica bacterium]|nr:glycosyltransferase family 9 protein [Candidatus Omnitrophota bacterium]
MKLDIKNILAVRNDRFGEFLLNIPALRAIKETFPEAALTLAVNSKVAELANSIKEVDNVIVWENRKHSLKEMLRFAVSLRKNKFDACVILNPSKEFNMISFLAGIPLRAGYDRKWGFLLTHKLKDTKYLAQKHEIDYNLDLVGLLGCSTKDKSLRLEIPAEAGTVLTKFGIKDGDRPVAIHPWTSDPIKQWPLANFRDLSYRINNELREKVVIVGGKEESNIGVEYFGSLGNDVLNLTGRTTLLELAAILARCKLLVSGDSGPVHLASCVGAPVIAIFRNYIPGKSARRWGPMGEHSVVIEKQDLNDISTGEVFNRIKERLDR